MPGPWAWLPASRGWSLVTHWRKARHAASPPGSKALGVQPYGTTLSTALSLKEPFLRR